MRKILPICVLVVALLAPTQIAFTAEKLGYSGETIEMNYQVFERMTETQMKLSEAMMKLMKGKHRMSHAKMVKIMNEIDSIEKQIQRLIEIGDE